MKILGLIPARKGSRGIRDKNLQKIGGRTLIEHAVYAARCSGECVAFALTTDYQEAMFLELNVDLVPRPAELARDDTPAVAVVRHTLDRFSERYKKTYEAVLYLQPTNPLRTVEDIKGAVHLMEATQCDSVISFTPVGERHPARMKHITLEGRVLDPTFAEEHEGKRRQELTDLYLRDGSIYLTRVSNIEAGRIEGPDCRAWMIPPERHCNIDTPFDLEYAQWLYERQTQRGLADTVRGIRQRQQRTCPHNNPPAECEACFQESDFQYDAARERR